MTSKTTTIIPASQLAPGRRIVRPVAGQTATDAVHQAEVVTVTHIVRNETRVVTRAVRSNGQLSRAGACFTYPPGSYVEVSD